MSKTRRDANRIKRRQQIDEWLKNKDQHFPSDPDGYYWASHYPHWWDTMYHHAPARRFNREKLHRVMKEGEEDDGDWRDHRKPHKYYW